MTPSKEIQKKADTILYQHFEIGPDDLDEVMEILSDLNLLNKDGLKVREYLWNKTIKKSNSFEEILEKGWNTFSAKQRECLIENRGEVTNPKVRKFLQSKLKE